MKLGIVSDIHTNVHGLRKALALMGTVDRLICLGDSIYEYRFSNEVVALLRETGAIVIQGNHEETFLSPLGIRARSSPGIDQSHLAWIAEQPLQRELRWAGKKLLLVHATPWEPRRAYVQSGHPDFPRFGDVDADFVFYGHTHVQVAERVGRVMVVNPGSAGEARDRSNGSLLSCAVVDLISEEVKFINFSDEQD